MRLEHVYENHYTTSYQCNLNCLTQAVLFSPVLICTYPDPAKHPYQNHVGFVDRLQVNKKYSFLNCTSQNNSFRY